MQYETFATSLHLPHWLWRLAAHMRAAANQSVRYAESNFAVIGLVAGTTYLLYYFVYTFLIGQSFESPLLRLIAALLAFPIAFTRRWPEWAKPWVPAYWIVSLTYCLPFFFTYMLLRSAQFDYETAHHSMIWPMSEVVALVLLIMLVNDGLLIGLMFLAGTVGAWALFLTVTDTVNYQAIKDGYLSGMWVYLFILVAGTIYNRHRETIQQEMLRAVAGVGNNIAHELRTPLLGIKSNSQGLKLFLPDLIAAYDLAARNGLAVKPIRRRQLDSLREALQRIDNETDYSNTIIDMLLINAGGGQITTESRVISALECINGAIARYPFVSDSERQLVHVSQKRDFRVRGSDLLFTHVLFNLIKNALYFIAKAGKGEIYVWLESNERINRIIVHDTGTGVHPSVLPRIFDRFFTSLESGRGFGIGLSFCKSVVETFNGRIECQSQYEHYTRFILSFPAVDEHD